MSQYRAELYNAGIPVYTQALNEELYTLLESIYMDEYPNDYTALKQIYSLLSDEVDDADYYDQGYDEDNDDLVDILFNYSIQYLVDKSLLAIQLGKYVTISEQRQFKTYEDYHQTLVSALHKSALSDDDGEHINVLLSLNEIVTADIMTKYNPLFDQLLHGKK